MAERRDPRHLAIVGWPAAPQASPCCSQVPPSTSSMHWYSVQLIYEIENLSGSEICFGGLALSADGEETEWQVCRGGEGPGGIDLFLSAHSRCLRQVWSHPHACTAAAEAELPPPAGDGAKRKRQALGCHMHGHGACSGSLSTPPPHGGQGRAGCRHLKSATACMFSMFTCHTVQAEGPRGSVHAAARGGGAQEGSARAPAACAQASGGGQNIQPQACQAQVAQAQEAGAGVTCHWCGQRTPAG